MVCSVYANVDVVHGMCSLYQSGHGTWYVQLMPVWTWYMVCAVDASVDVVHGIAR